MVAFDISHRQPAEPLAGVLRGLDLPSIEFDLPSMDFPQVALPDALSSLAAFANQLQAVVATAFSHPFWAIVIIIVSIGFLQLVADLVKRLIKAGLTLILTLPIGLSQWIWKRATTASAPAVDEKARIAQLFHQLETLRTEQDQAMAELKELLQESATVGKANVSQAVINKTKQTSLPAASATPSLQSQAEPPQS